MDVSPFIARQPVVGLSSFCTVRTRTPLGLVDAAAASASLSHHFHQSQIKLKADGLAMVCVCGELLYEHTGGEIQNIRAETTTTTSLLLGEATNSNCNGTKCNARPNPAQAKTT